MAKVLRKEVIRKVIAVRDARKNIDKALTDVAEDEFDSEILASKFAELQDAVIALRDYLALDNVRSSASNFLEGLANSMVQTQKKLDEHNRQYVRQALAEKDIIPTQFRLPRLEADLRFALETISSSGWNILIYSKETETRELNQQTLKAELVAAPPPPDLLEWFRAVLPNIVLVLAPEERERVRQVVELKASPRAKKTLLDNGHWARVLILKHAEPASYALFLTLKKAIEDEKDLGIWHVSLDPPEFTVAYSYDRGPASPTERTAQFRTFLNSLIERQVFWLKAQE